MFKNTFNVRLDGKTIECKPYTLRDYVALNLSKTTGTVELMKQTYSRILAESTGGQKLNKHESELALVNIIARSEHFEETMLDYECECGFEFKTKVNIAHATVDYNDSDISKLYKFKNFSIALKWPDLWADDDVTSMIVNAIDAIYVGDERIEINDLSDAELDDLFNAITEDDINYIKKILLAPKVSLGVPVKCPNCGKLHAHQIIGFKEFVDIL